MKRLYIYIIMCAFALASCQQDIPVPSQSNAVLELDLLRAGHPVVSTRAVADGLTVEILDANGQIYTNADGPCQYSPGQVPRKIVLVPGTFTVRAYSPNQDGAWKTENGGKGAGCYYAETTVQMEYDAVTHLKLDVPMMNYAVGLQLPEMFDILFNPSGKPFPESYTFTLQSGGRTVTIKEGERAYFDVADGGFSYALSATNNDNNTHQHSAIDFTEVSPGKLFTIKYDYSNDINTGGVVIVITDDMEIVDAN